MNFLANVFLKSTSNLTRLPRRDIYKVFLVCLVRMRPFTLCLSFRDCSSYYFLCHLFFFFNLASDKFLSLMCRYLIPKVMGAKKHTVYSLANAHCVKFIKYCLHYLTINFITFKYLKYQIKKKKQACD